MKKQILMVAALTACFGFGASAQVSVNVNFGAQPVWGPVGYDYVEYYYMPDIDAYYDVPHQQYVYMENNTWVTRRNLPPRYSNYDLYGGHKVVINERDPWMHNDRYRQQYGQYRGRHDQVVIRDSRDVRYYENPGHPHHNEWRGDNRGNGNGYQRRGNDHEERHDNGRGNGRDEHRDNGHGEGHGNGNGHGEGHGEGHGHDNH